MEENKTTPNSNNGDTFVGIVKVIVGLILLYVGLKSIF